MKLRHERRLVLRRRRRYGDLKLSHHTAYVHVRMTFFWQKKKKWMKKRSKGWLKNLSEKNEKNNLFLYVLRCIGRTVLFMETNYFVAGEWHRGNSGENAAEYWSDDLSMSVFQTTLFRWATEDGGVFVNLVFRRLRFSAQINVAFRATTAFTYKSFIIVSTLIGLIGPACCIFRFICVLAYYVVVNLMHRRREQGVKLSLVLVAIASIKVYFVALFRVSTIFISPC